MSMDAGGLAQMTYQSPFNNAIGVSGPGFASRGKGTHIKRLSVAPPPKITPIDETQQVNVSSTPRTSRGHLLAGLRTAPKSATVASTNANFGLEASKYASGQYNIQSPQTATAGGFGDLGRSNFGMRRSPPAYSLPEHVLAPPALDLAREDADHMDQRLYDELLATNAYLAQQQRSLQQQLLNVTAAAQQLGGLNLNATLMGNVPTYQPAIASPMSMYNQQLQQGLQPIVQPVPGSPGVYAVYNPMTGQSSFVVDHTVQAPEIMSPTYAKQAQSPPASTADFSRQYSPALGPVMSPAAARSGSPPKSTPSPPHDVEPLPPPSANAFRRGHKKSLSSANNVKLNGDWTKTGAPRSAGFPQTPVTGTFGPGQGRAGEHPIRQPRGPPLLQELLEKPTSKYEGSKNFATRQRRRAVLDLQAGRERRSEARQASSDGGSPGSEREFNLTVSPDGDETSLSGAKLSNRPSLGSLRAAASGVIGSERKEKSCERGSGDTNASYSSKLSGDEGTTMAGGEADSSRRRTPRLVLSSAEKRKSAIV